MVTRVWMILISIWLLLWGLLSISNFQFEASRVILGILAIAGGGFLLADAIQRLPARPVV